MPRNMRLESDHIVPQNPYMTITATVHEGKIELPLDVNWPSGTVVRIEPVEDQPPPLSDLCKDFDGMAGDLPSDLAENLDHYLQGDKRS